MIDARTPPNVPCAADATRLDDLDAAAVGLLEPLIGAMPAADDGASPDARADARPWSIGLGHALERLRMAAQALDLDGFAEVVALLGGHLREMSAQGLQAEAGAGFAAAADAAGVAGVGVADAAIELAERWVGDAIAFCSGQLAGDEAANLVSSLSSWPGLAQRLARADVARIEARLRSEAQRIAAGALADHGPDPMDVGDAGAPAAPSAGAEAVAQPGAALAIGEDELQMLAEAARQLEEEFGDALPAAGPTSADSLESVADAIERYANAIAYVGLAPVSEALFGLLGNLAAFVREPALFGARQRSLLDRLPSLWAQLFDAPSQASAQRALAPLADPAWPMPIAPAVIDAASRAFAAIVTVGSRRVVLADEALESDMSLAIPEDADRGVVENLLRELPALCAQFSESIEHLRAGSREQVVQAQRIAHTLKGSANTVGVRGIAMLTHQLEDLLQLLEPIEAPMSAALVDALADAADCLAEMGEAVAGLGTAPSNALEIHAAVREWTRRVLEDPAAASRESAAPRTMTSLESSPPAAEAHSHGHADAPRVSPASVPAAAPAATSAATPASTASAEPPSSAGHDSPAEDWLRVPASLIERLLAFANEASILLSQAQERSVEVDRVRSTLSVGTDQLQDLAAELERLVDVRGLTLNQRRERDDFDPLELDEHNDLQMVSRRIAESGADGRLIEQQLGRHLAALRDSLSQLERLQVDLREAALQTRTVRIDAVVPRWRRTVRQAARMAGREVELQVRGEDTEIDAQLLQALVEPVGHLLRNAVDHGIEAPAQRERLGKPRVGAIALSLRRDGADLLVECSDDGAGLDLVAIRARAVATGLVAADEPIDAERLARMILAPGFSTREHATQLSGRGIGLDVVAQAVRAQRGAIDIEPRGGGGTCVRLRLPVRIAALPVVVVRSSACVLALSVRDVERIAAVEDLRADGTGQRVLCEGERRWRAVRLEDALGLPEDAFAPPPGIEAARPVVLQVRMPDARRIGLIVPEPGQPRNVVLRPLAAFLPPIPGLEGATVLGDGVAAPVYDLPRLLADRAGARAAPPMRERLPALPVCLVVDDSVSVRRSMEQFVRDLGYEADSAGDGVEALERVRTRVPALVLVDLEMPRMNGVEFVRALRAGDAGRDVPVIMITSRSSEKHRNLALGAGVNVFLTKPYTEDVLATHIAQCTRAPATP